MGGGQGQTTSYMTYAAATQSFDFMQEKWKPVGWDGADPFLSGATHSLLPGEKESETAAFYFCYGNGRLGHSPRSPENALHNQVI